MKQFERIAADLERRIDEDLGYELSSIYALAQQFAVSYRTMWKVVHLLASRGKVAVARGKRIERIAAGYATQPSMRSPENRLHQIIHARIADGTYTVGESLPKLNSFVIAEHVSTQTVTGALRRLEHEGLVHKAGKLWITGPRPRAVGEPSISLTSRTGPVIVLFSPGRIHARDFFQNEHTGKFARAFQHELMKHAVHMSLAHPSAGEKTTFICEGEIDEVGSLVRRLGKRYIGSLVAYSNMEVRDLDILLPALCFFDRPVVYFDSADQGPHLTRESIAAKKTYFRMYPDEPAAVGLALRCLAEMNHREIGMPNFFPTNDAHWATKRIRLASRLAERFDPALRIHSVQVQEEFLDYANFSVPRMEFISSPLMDRVNSTRQSAEDTLRRESMQRVILKNTPSMVSLLREEITAMMPLNDTIAYQCYEWLDLAGICIPRHMSMVTFDNYPSTAVLPLSTIDFGFTQLGYIAAHIFINDIPIASDIHGFIAGKPILLDRGSIGKPRTASLKETVLQDLA